VGLGGAARSTQPKSLVSAYYNLLKACDGQERDDNLSNSNGRPFYFYYNPHRYPEFMAGIKDICDRSHDIRKDIFVASGGTDRSEKAMDQRLTDALEYSGGHYLDMFVLEYVCPYEIGSNGICTDSLARAIEKARSWVDQGLVRYVAASTHSHIVGATLAKESDIDSMMLRYSMSHKDAAKAISLPAAIKNKKPVMAFTTTRWNALQRGHDDWNGSSDKLSPPTTAECLSYALASSPSVEIVLHSARDEEELLDAIGNLSTNMPDLDLQKWEKYGNLDWNDDGFDEYPEERERISAS